MLIVAEKFRMASVLAKVLGFKRFRFPFFENEAGDVICYSQGHLFTLSHGQDDYYSWTQPMNFERLPRVLNMVPSKDYEITVKGKKLSTAYLRENVPRLMREHEVIVNACDADREGERVFYDLFNAADTEAQIYRLDLSRGITRSIITQAYENMLCATKSKSCNYASQARTCADFAYALLTVVTTYYGRKSLLHPLLGGYTDKHESVVPVGRLIIPVLKLIADRSMEVEAIQYRHVSVPVVEGTVQVGDAKVDVRFKYDYERLGFAPSLLSDARLASQYVKNKSTEDEFIIAGVEHIVGVQSAPELFDTASMQAEMSHLSPSETMDILQSLYEKGLITYPRTDETDVPDDEVSSTRLRLLFDSMQSNLSTVSDSTTKASTRFLEKHDSLVERANDTQTNSDDTQASHTALMPTNAHVDLSQLSDNELGVYTKICERVTSHLQGDQPVCHVVVYAKFRNDDQGMLGEVEPSFTFEREVKTRADGTSSNRFMQFQEGDVISLTSVRCEAVPVNVPEYYCESEIPLVMRNVGLNIDDPKYRDILVACKGLGTAATRDKCVPSLVSRSLVEISHEDGKRRCVVTSKGLALLDVLPDEFSNPITTGLWEHELKVIEDCNDLEKAREMRNTFIAKVYQTIEKYICYLNRQYAKGANVQACNVLPTPELIRTLKERARLLSLPIPSNTLKSTKLCNRWLDENPVPVHSTQRSKLEHSGLTMSKGVERDTRRVALRERALANPTDNPPTQKALLTAARLASIVGTKVPAKAKRSAKDCKEFIDSCNAKRQPSPDQVAALKKLCKPLGIVIPQDVLTSRRKTKEMINKLRKRSR